jgi:hypothetical protein
MSRLEAADNTVTADTERAYGVGEILLFCRSSARHTVRLAGLLPLAGRGSAERVMLTWR